MYAFFCFMAIGTLTLPWAAIGFVLLCSFLNEEEVSG